MPRRVSADTLIKLLINCSQLRSGHDDARPNSPFGETVCVVSGPNTRSAHSSVHSAAPTTTPPTHPTATAPTQLLSLYPIQLLSFSGHARLVAAVSITMTWEISPLPAFRFSRPKDKGVTIYLLLVSIWFYLQLPPMILAPVFFADPAGAVVGKACTRHFPRYNPAWYGQKSVCGSLAVFTLTFCTISFPCNLIERIAIANAATIAEAFGGDYDNLALAATVLIGWRITNDYVLT